MQSARYERIQNTLDNYPDAWNYKALIQAGQVQKCSDGSLELILTPVSNKGKLIVGKQYRFDAKRRLIYVPLSCNIN